MSSPSHRREFSVKKPFEPPPRRTSRSLSLDEPNADPEAPVLPPPVAAIPTTYNRPKKTIRIDGGRGLRVYWARFRRRLGTGTSPSTSSLVDGSAQGSNDGLRSDVQGGRQGEDDAEVDEVVIDRNWSDDIKSSVSLSEQDISLDRPGGHPIAGPNTDRDSDALHTGGFWGLCTPLVILRWRLFPAIIGFFSSKLPNQKSERHYVKENWFVRKPLAMWSSLFLVVNWALNAALVPGPILLIDKIFVYGIAPACTFPVLVLVIYDWPRDRPNAYQVVLAIATWSWAIYILLYILLCGQYNPNFSLFSCGKRDFLGLF
jgi:osomolarity two-component system sensor histidine kinase SLN1